MYLIVAFGLIGFRMYLDRGVPFLSNDGEIKYYQTIQYADGPMNFECLYPAREMDPEYNYFIFRIPWAKFDVAGKKCIFQYPPFFSYLGTVLLKTTGSFRAPFFIPVLFIIINIFLTDLLLRKEITSGFHILIFSLIPFVFTHTLLSSIDYSEMSLFHTFILISLLLTRGLIRETVRDESDSSPVHGFPLSGFFLGVVIVSIFYIRSEVVVFAAVLFMVTLAHTFRNVYIRPVILSTVVGVGITFALFTIYNLYAYGSYLDIRALDFVSTVSSDAKRYELSRKLDLVMGYLFRSSEKRGLWYAFPHFYFAIIFFLPFYYKRVGRFGQIVFTTGYAGTLLAAFLAPSIGGVQNFGLRYLDAGFVPFVPGLGIMFHNFVEQYKGWKRWSIYALFFLLFIPVYKFNKTGIDTMITGTGLYNQILDRFSRVNNGYVIHHSAQSNYLVGYSYLHQKHILVTNNDQYETALHKLKEMGVRQFMVIDPVEKFQTTRQMPKSMYPYYFTNITVEPTDFEKYEEEQFLIYRLRYYRSGEK